MLETEHDNVLKPLSATQAFFNTRLKYFGDDFTKITCFSKSVFNPNKCERHTKIDKKDDSQLDFERQLNDFYKDKQSEHEKNQDTRNEKRTDSVKRAKDKVFEIAFSNDFQ
ncbi:MAG: hypothetical protein RR284_03510, partial [Ruthenibacterium sp.]